MLALKTPHKGAGMSRNSNRPKADTYVFAVVSACPFLAPTIPGHTSLHHPTIPPQTQSDTVEWKTRLVFSAAFQNKIFKIFFFHLYCCYITFTMEQ